MITCCRGCDERYIGCHSACATYKKQAEENAKMLEAKRQSQFYVPHWGSHNTLQMMRRTMSAAK